MALLSLLDALYCQEESLELEEEQQMAPVPSILDGPEADRCLLQLALVAEEEWVEVLCSLAAKEAEPCAELSPAAGGEQAYFLLARREAVEWVASAAARHAFSVLTVLLAVNYLDRCFLPSAGGGGGLRLQKDKPWMGRLAAVACLSLAAKVEETSVPLLLDLQVSPETEAEMDNNYVFEAKTIRRMELLVLSALGWRMNPVTPLSFIHHMLPRLCSRNTNPISTVADAARIKELLNACEATLLSVIADWRWIRYPASAWAAVALLNATAVSSLMSHEADHLISFLKVPKETLEECYQLVNESMACSGGIIGQKRKHSSHSYCHYSSPPSPNGVLGSCFSCESSSTVSSPPEICPSKRPKNSANKAFGHVSM